MKAALYRKVLKMAKFHHAALTKMGLDASLTYSLSYDATSTPDPDDKKQYVIFQVKKNNFFRK